MRKPFSAKPESRVPGGAVVEVPEVESPCREPQAEQGNLLREVRECLPMLPIMSAQLQEVARHTEDSVVRVCESFQGMAQRARQAVDRLSLVGTDSNEKASSGADAIQNLISSARETMGALLGRIEQTSEFSNLTVDRMQTMERQIGDLNKTLRQIDEVAKNARLLALNGQLEAARAGEHGAAFAVVAKETALMADHAVASSKTIEGLIGAISASMESASAALRQRAAADTQMAARSREEVRSGLDTITSLHEQRRRAIDESKASSEQLAREISAAVVAMQFQDTVCQRIGHVVHSLEEIHRALEPHANPDPVPGSQTQALPSANWTGRMTEKYTMESERAVFAAHATSSPTSAHDPGNNVELF